MSKSRSSITVAGLAGLILVSSIIASPVAQAQINGHLEPAAAPWVAALGIFKDGGSFSCSGAVVGDKWILTAAHCVSGGDGKGPQVADTAVTVRVGSTSPYSGGQVSTVDEIIRPASYPVTPGTDVALVHLVSFDENRWHALPLAFESAVVDRTPAVNFYGYGTRSVSGSTGLIQPLQKSYDGAYTRTPSCDGDVAGISGLICYSPGSRIRLVGLGANSLAKGDSGSPAVVKRYGALQLAAVADDVDYQPSNLRPAPKVGATSMLSNSLRSEGFDTVADWVFENADIFSAAAVAGEIVRNATSGQSWLAGADGYRYYISSPAIYNCLRRRIGSNL